MTDPINRDGLRDRFWSACPCKTSPRASGRRCATGVANVALTSWKTEDTSEVAFTRVACRLLDDTTCRCAHYEKRKVFVSECVVLTPQNIGQKRYWMPPNLRPTVCCMKARRCTTGTR